PKQKEASSLFPWIALMVLVFVVVPVGYLIKVKSRDLAVTESEPLPVEAPRPVRAVAPATKRAPAVSAAPAVNSLTREEPKKEEGVAETAKIDSDPDNVERDA